MQKPRIIVWDIETAPNLVTVWRLANNDWISPENIQAERYIICVSWKILGEKKTHSISVLDDPKLYGINPQSDYHVCKELHKVLSEADVLIHHNGNTYDIKFTETRMLYHGLSPLPPITQIDTLSVAKSRFLFNSNKLDYIAKFLKVGKKIDTTFNLWLRAIKGDKRAIQEMVRYNKQDVMLLEKVFNKLQPYVANHVNRQLYGQTGCPRCGSSHVQSRGVHRAVTRTYQRFQCQSCLGWFKSTKPEAGVKTRTL